MKRALVAAILFCTVQALGATPSPDGWADLHWGMTAKQVLALYPKGIVKATKTPENIWIVLPPISLPGGKYTVEAGVKDKAGLWAVVMGPAEKRTRTIAETKERLRELEDALVLKYGQPAIKREELTTWRLEKLQIELRWMTHPVTLLLLVYLSPSNNSDRFRPFSYRPWRKRRNLAFKTRAAALSFTSPRCSGRESRCARRGADATS